MNGVLQQKARKHYVGWIVLGFLVVLVVVIVLNRAWVYDWFRGMIYHPTAEVVEIRNKLDLTGRGKFLFNAAQPELDNAEEFNAHCRRDKSEVAVLGCYTMGNIYVYDITDVKLAGIRELTMAHELLHAVWARMSESERKTLEPVLQQVYKNNLAVLKDDIDTYAEDEKLEEVFVRAGTEIKSLPAELEKYYAEIFENQDIIVDFYDSYIAVFREIKTRMEKLASEMEVLQGEINAKTAEYETGVAVLETDVANFNSCAETAGCFVSEWEFYAQRNALLMRESALDELNDEINNLVDTYNAKVDEYNADVTESRKLQNMINSKAKVVEIK